MTAAEPILAVAAGAVSLALAAMLWALAQSRAATTRTAALAARLAEARNESGLGALEPFDAAVIAVQDGRARLAAGAGGLARAAEALGETRIEPQSVVTRLAAADPAHARKLAALFERGEPCAFEAQGAQGLVRVEGRAAGAVAWLRLSAAQRDQALPAAARLADLADAQPTPAWIAAADATPLWANRAWLAAAGATGLDDAQARGLAFDRGADALVREAARSGAMRETLRWSTVDGRRRALRIAARPLDGGGVGVWTHEVTELEDLREQLKRNIEAHDETLNHIADAVAIFAADRRLAFHNTAFASLWDLEPAWLAERPTHGEVLDRLRQRRRLPESADYGRWKAEELAQYGALAVRPDDLWSLPDGRTLRVVRQPHPLGGLLVLFSDITDELKLKAQYNGQIQVQQATLDKLNDAVAVFGADGRLRLHNEAFARFWGIEPQALDQAGDFEGVVELCIPRLHDRGFWRDLKGRVADPDPGARAAVSGEVRTADSRIAAFQSRPLPDGATLIGFVDVTDARSLEAALAAREGALAEAERLKRDFVGNVSYELRTPLTTIIGYAELLGRAEDNLSERGRVHAAAVRAAAVQLARSISDVLDMALIDADELALDLGDVDVSALLDEVAATCSAEALAAQVTLHVDASESPGLIRGDGRRLSQILGHLVENALTQTPAGGRITLSARKALGEVQLKVADTGRGIAFHVQAHIFDRFVGREHGGPGLSLALVKALTELHGGWVALESEPGQGATFTCHLPEDPQGAAPGQAQLSFVRPGAL
ncbi:sensor histidine kinase [Phenylobacterium immobile]|uniref:sensor histidine kinase n=1 Tax=Phenylobacterium immobile TaxID=21 RepID=UPI000ABD1B14|nr:PAS domain-containing sensor histidine kinase [Phenylobacterium immobile]